MWVVYVLQSLRDGNLYIGCTENLQQRINYHNKGYVQSTKHRAPLKIIYTENYSDKYQAFNRERYYKSAKGKKEIKEKILNRSGIV